MPNKLQKSAQSKKAKHVPAEGSDLWVEGHKDLPLPSVADMNQILRVRSYVDLLYMGMKDMLRWLKEIEEYLGGDSSVVVMEDINLRLRKLENDILTQTKRLDDALKEVE